MTTALSITASQREAIRILGAYTANRFDVWILAGNAKASCRAHVMSVLAGKRVPQSKSGVNALCHALNTLAGADGSCEAYREEQRVDFCRQVMGLPAIPRREKCSAQ